MEYLSKKLASYIFERGIIPKESIEIYQYGFQCFLEVGASTVCSILIALFLHMLPECLFFFLFFIPIRSFSGGLHMKTYLACFIGSCLILISTLLIVNHFTVPLFISFIAYSFSAICILIIGPVDHPNREVDCQDNRIFIRRTHLVIFFSLLTAFVLIAAQNTRYMLLQAIVFVFIFITSLIGRLAYKPS